jgi:Cys-rich protein (TIGR01571 family)
MLRAIHALAVLSASVSFAASLVTTEKHTAASFKQVLSQESLSGENVAQRSERQALLAEVDTAFQHAVTSVLRQENSLAQTQRLAGLLQSGEEQYAHQRQARLAKVDIAFQNALKSVLEEERPLERAQGLAALLQSGEREFSKQRRAQLAKVDAAFQVALQQVLRETSMAKMDAALEKGLKKALDEAREYEPDAKTHSIKVVAPAAAAALAAHPPGVDDHLFLTDILGKLHVYGLLTKTHESSLRASRSSGSMLDSWRSNFSMQLRTHSGALRCVMQGFISVVLWAVLVLLLGTCYHHKKQHPPQLDPEGVNVSLHDRERLDRHRWRFALFECSEVPSLCLFTVLCAPICWADTMRMAGFMNFFAALALVVALTVLGCLSFGLGFCVLIGVCVHYRQRMRNKFDIHSQVCGSYTLDVLAYVFCPWCSIVQEARQMEEAYLARHPSAGEDSIAKRLAARRHALGKVCRI